MGAVIDHRRQIGCGCQNGLEMMALGGRRIAPRQYAGNNHQAGSADLLGMSCQSHGGSGIDRAGANDHWQAGRNQKLHALPALGIG
jgi:hypothetical protein